MDLLREIVSSVPSGSSINDEDTERLSTDTDGPLDKSTSSSRRVHFMCEENIEYSDSSANDNHIEQADPSSVEPVLSQKSDSDSADSAQGTVEFAQEDVTTLGDTDVVLIECSPQVTDGVCNSQVAPPLTEDTSSAAIDKKPPIPGGKKKVRKRMPGQLRRKNSKHEKPSLIHSKSPVVSYDTNSGTEPISVLADNSDLIGGNEGDENQVSKPVQHIKIPDSLLDTIIVDNTTEDQPSKTTNKHKSKKLLSRRRPQIKDNVPEKVDVLEQKYAELYSLLQGSGQISMTSVTGHVQQLLIRAASLQEIHKKQDTSFDGSDNESLSAEDIFQHGSLNAWEPLVHLPIHRCESANDENVRTRSRQSKHGVNGRTKHIYDVYGEPLRSTNKTTSANKLLRKKSNSVPNMLHPTVRQRKDLTETIGSDISSKQSDCSNVPVVPVDHQLKTSPEPAIKAWLKTKNQLYRLEKQKKRKKRTEDRQTNRDALETQMERAIKCEEAQRAWLKSKNTEFRLAKQKEKKLTDTQNAEGPSHQSGTLNSDSSSELQNQTYNEINPSPPFVQSVSETKFVYKRPVSGSIKLKIHTPKRSKSPQSPSKQGAKTPEVDSSKVVPEKTRMSYDQWLLQKRENDKLKQQEKEAQRKLAKSDPELDKLIPELARKRIDNILNTKKRVDCNFKGADVDDINTDDNNNSNDSPATPSFSYRLSDTPKDAVTEQKDVRGAGLLKDNGCIRPRPCKSPDMRRPVSASSSTNPFRLPFPPELGVPRFVAERQQKLFSQSVDSKQESDNQQNTAPTPPNSKSDTNTVLAETVTLDTPESVINITSLPKVMTPDSTNDEVKGDVNTESSDKLPPPPDIVQSSRVFITNEDEL